MTIRPPTGADHPQWRRLWEEYLHFYQQEPDPESTGHLWARLLDDEDPVEGLIAESEGELVGIVHFFSHPDTWQPKPVCYLQDLYVGQPHRGRGLGRSLIQEVVKPAAEAEWSQARIARPRPWTNDPMTNSHGVPELCSVRAAANSRFNSPKCSGQFLGTRASTDPRGPISVPVCFG